VEKVSSVQDHVDVMLLRQAHYFVEGLPAVVLTVRIAFVVANVAVGGDKYTDRVSTW
jgi:hypothetical protein